MGFDVNESSFMRRVWILAALIDVASRRSKAARKGAGGWVGR